MNQFLVVISATLFFFYGISCVFFKSLKSEFIRYGLSKYRKTVGVLEILGALGQIIGLLEFRPILILSSFCLLLLMICGIFIRLKVKDTFYQLLPAIFLLLINSLIIYNLTFS